MKTKVDEAEVPFGANEVRLSPRQWGVAAILVLLVTSAAPALWRQFEPFTPSADYRVPYALSEDYWVFDRFARKSLEERRRLVIGDSVIWGEYVRPGESLTHFLNELNGNTRFCNGGVNGSHPLALEGLIRDYGRHIVDCDVVLHCNPLWMSSPERDLQTSKEVTFNHPRLVPQQPGRVPCYKASMSERLGIVADRYISFRAWAHHQRIAHFDEFDLPNWSLEHPYEDPWRRIRRGLPEPDEQLRHRPVSWAERGIPPQDWPWVPLESSLQWKAFQNTVLLLRSRGNRLFVIVGPFNEHMLTEGSLRRYAQRKQAIGRWLVENNVPHYVPVPLPSDQYADASHPLSSGYRRLAERIGGNADFRRWLGAG